jgi:hypothetical protein
MLQKHPKCFLFQNSLQKYLKSQKERFRAIFDKINSNSGLNDPLKVVHFSPHQVSREKTEYMRCDFGGNEIGHNDEEVRIDDQILQPKVSFRYLGSMFHKSGKIDDDVTHRIRAGWAKWRASS